MADKTIYIAGHRGLAGSALLRLYSRLPGWRVITRTHAELELKDTAAVRAFFAQERPTHVVLAAAKVGGINANRLFQVEFLLDNLRIQNNVLEAAADFGVAKLLFLGSSCVYPKHAPQPIHEDALLTSPLEPTNEGYALAKIAGLKLCAFYRRQHGRDFISAMPTNLYGPNDNFDLEKSHVLPALIRRFHEAKVSAAPTVTLWGTGTPRREFLHADDFAEACAALMDRYESDQLINVGTGEDETIRELAELIRDIVGYRGEIVWDATMPDGTPRKLLDVSRINALGWKARIPLADGIRSTYEWFVQHRAGK
ncbi:MAG: GDP-L-fucose synthase [Limisphaerales bacterium]|nr:MAG: GDP-L-fucose synthase [Limisphaerales bacterium]KAG0509889.1 MAG: GDP-L-fucose synthase [Limisphaerales bacterium]TXT50640.1 MAG: GDP-L-fucose synthase [Limisphaerales bacterium]